MPTEITATATQPGLDAASRRIFRLAIGTALSMWYSQVVAWPLSFIAPVFTMFILALPLPAPSFKSGIKFIIALMLPVIVGMAFLPLLEYARWVGIAAVGLALFYSFYYTAKGGSPLIGTFMTIGLTLVVTIGSVSIDVMLALVKGLAAGAAFGMLFVWIAHGLMPETPVAGRPTSPPVTPRKPGLPAARRNALRSMLVTFPLALLFMFSSASPSYTVVMIKVATMGQQANSDKSREMGRSLLESTLWGGLGAIIGWQIMSIWPSLVMYTLLIGIAGLIFGSRIFNGPGLHPKFSMWSYAYLTMIVVLAPALLDGQSGSDAGAAFYSRLLLFIGIAIYGSTTVAVFDAFWPSKPDKEI